MQKTATVADVDSINSFYSQYKAAHPDYIKRLDLVYRKFGVPGKLLEPFLYGQRKSHVKYIFAGNVSYFADLITYLEPANSLFLVNGLRSYWKLRRCGFPATLSTGLFADLTGFTQGNAESVQRVLGRLTRLSDTFRQLGATYLFVQSDSMPLERLLICAARGAGVKTVCAQHGIFSKMTVPQLIEGRFADVFLAYDSEQAAIVGGHDGRYPTIVSGSLSENVRLVPRSFKRAICFFGQPYPLLFPRKTEAYIRLVIAAQNVCRRYGYDFVYKPHPGELNAPYLNQIPSVVAGDAHTFYRQYDYFVAVSSTTLHEASIRGKIAIQIVEDTLHSERFSKYGYCYSLSLEQFGQFLFTLHGAAPYHSPTLETFNEGDLQSRWTQVKKELELFQLLPSSAAAAAAAPRRAPRSANERR